VRPVKAFSSEMTIGTSAPPTGSTNSTPSTSDAAPSASRIGTDGEITSATDRPTAASATSGVITLPPGTTTGRDVISSCSFMNVTIEPANETLPTSTVNDVAARVPADSPSPALRNSMIATTAAAPPPTPLNSATS